MAKKTKNVNDIEASNLSFDEEDLLNSVLASRDDDYPIESKTRNVIVVDVEHKDDDENLEADVKRVRESLIDLIAQGSESVKELMELACSSEHPRSYEVLHGFIKTMVDANKELLDIHKTKTDIDKKRNKDVGPVTNNTLVVMEGTAAELLEQIKKQNEK